MAPWPGVRCPRARHASEPSCRACSARMARPNASEGFPCCPWDSVVVRYPRDDTHTALAPTLLPARLRCRSYKGYEEVRVPAVAPSVPPPGEVVVDINTLPEWAQLAFQGYKRLNRIQVGEPVQNGHILPACGTVWG